MTTEEIKLDVFYTQFSDSYYIDTVVTESEIVFPLITVEDILVLSLSDSTWEVPHLSPLGVRGNPCLTDSMCFLNDSGTSFSSSEADLALYASLNSRTTVMWMF